MKPPTIEFVNHASVVISYNQTAILSDPWYNGTSFHEGWRLIHETEEDEIINTLNKITHIYISHEHPDHFRPSFFTNKKIKNILLSRKIEFLFQYTKDKRIVNFIKKQGYAVKEFNLNEKVKLDNDIEVQIIKSGFYDSFLILKTPDFKIINMNDCPIKSENDLNKLKKEHGDFDILLTQFSYAAWKGGIKNEIYRKIAAKEKLETVEKQARILGCKSVIPFASFIYFSHELNYYMNDSVNTPEKIINFFSSKKTNIVIMSPGEIQKIDNLEQNKISLDFWKKKYDEIDKQILKPKDKYVESIDLKSLNLDFEKYQKNIFNKNSKFLIFLLSKFKLMNFFQSLKINLIDHNKIYKYSLFGGLIEDYNYKEYDIKMHSQSLAFLFKNEFGFDTLTVNGCFEADNEGFTKVTKTLAIGNLNAMGLHLNFGLIFHPKIIILFLKLLQKVKKKLNKL